MTRREPAERFVDITRDEIIFNTIVVTAHRLSDSFFDVASILECGRDKER